MDSLVTAFTDPTALAALIALVVMEVVLGIDNLVFISILTNKLPEAQRPKARRIGIGLALAMGRSTAMARRHSRRNFPGGT